MNTQRLYLADGTPLELWRCGKCGTTQTYPDNLDRCCMCSGCGKELPNYHHECDDCRNARAKRIEAETLDKAAIVTEYEAGMLYSNKHEKFFDSMEQYITDIEPADREEFLYVAPWQHFDLDGNDFLQGALDQLGWSEAEWGDPFFEGVDELLAAVEKFNARNRHVKLAYADEKRKVRLSDQSTGTRSFEWNAACGETEEGE